MKNLFDDTDPPPPPIRVRDPNAHPAAHKRLTRQSEDILAILRRGRATNGTLAGVTSRYGARIFDIRAWFKATGQGHLEIRIVEQDNRSGRVVYALLEHGVEVGAAFRN